MLSPLPLYRTPTWVRLPAALFRSDGSVPTFVALAVNHEYRSIRVLLSSAQRAFWVQLSSFSSVTSPELDGQSNSVSQMGRPKPLTWPSQ
jgi:hypothetical protein